MLLFYKSDKPLESVGCSDFTMGKECTHGKEGLLLKFKPTAWPIKAYCPNNSNNNNEGQCHEKSSKTASIEKYDTL